MVWSPQSIVRVVCVHDTSTKPAKAVTDAGPALIKTPTNPEGPHALVREWVGTVMAGWLGLPTFDLAIMDHSGEPAIEKPDGSWKAEPGPVIAIRWVPGGHAWDGTEAGLAEVENLDAAAGLVVLDTWIRNPDRYWVRGNETLSNVRNVFLSDEGARPGKFRLVAMDHTACFRGSQMLTRKVGSIDNVKDPDLYGLFPAFLPYVNPESVAPFARKLRGIRRQDVAGFLRGVHPAWQLPPEVSTATAEFIIDRAAFVSDTVVQQVGDLQKQLRLPMDMSSS